MVFDQAAYNESAVGQQEQQRVAGNAATTQTPATAPKPPVSPAPNPATDSMYGATQEQETAYQQKQANSPSPSTTYPTTPTTPKTPSYGVPVAYSGNTYYIDPNKTSGLSQQEKDTLVWAIKGGQITPNTTASGVSSNGITTNYTPPAQPKTALTQEQIDTINNKYNSYTNAEQAAAYKQKVLAATAAYDTTPLFQGKPATTGQSTATGGAGSGGYQAPNGKNYNITVDPTTGKASFVWINGQTETYNSVQDAKAYIDSQNPGWSTPSTMQNQPINENPYGWTGTTYDATTGTVSSDNATANAELESAANTKNANMTSAQQASQQALATVNTLVSQTQGIEQQQADIINTRINSITDSFSKIDTMYDTLQSQLTNQLEANITSGQTAEAESIANTGGYTSLSWDQGAAAALADYRRTADTKIADIGVQITQQKQQAQQDEATALDAVQKDNNTNLQDQQTQMNAIQQAYQGIYDALDTKQESVNNQYQTDLASAMNPFLQENAQLSTLIEQNTEKSTILQQNKQQAQQDPTARQSYIMSQVQSISNNLAPYAEQVISSLQSQWLFMWEDVDQQVAAIITQAQQLYNIDQLNMQSGRQKIANTASSAYDVAPAYQPQPAVSDNTAGG